MKYLITVLFMLSLQVAKAQIILKIKSIEIDYDVHYVSERKQLYNGIWLNINLELVNDTFDVIQIHPPEIGGTLYMMYHSIMVKKWSLLSICIVFYLMIIWQMVT